MPEVDFLPDWYHQRRRRQILVQRQYLALGMIFLFMILWNSFATRNISMASAELSLAETQRIGAERMSEEYRRLRQRLLDLKSKLDVSRVMDARLDVAGTMSQLSEAVPEQVVLQGLQLKATAFTDPSRPAQKTDPISSDLKSKPPRLVLSADPVRFAVTIKGRTLDTQAMALFLSDLERSPFFNDVHLRYLRSTPLASEPGKLADDADDRRKGTGLAAVSESTEFEIRCTVAAEDLSPQR